MERYNEFLRETAGIVPDLKRHPLDHVLEYEVLKDGPLVELGVFRGASISKIANRYPNRCVYGFDSFEGLPESWNRPDGHFGKGFFDLKRNLPEVPANVELIAGWFDQTLPAFAERLHKENCHQISLLHVDCDIYSSTKTTFDTLGPFLRSGTVIVFDELFNYPTYEKHEILAWYEFIHAHDIKFSWIGKNGKVILNPMKDNGYWDQPAALRIL